MIRKIINKIILIVALLLGNRATPNLITTNIYYVSYTGSGNICSTIQPCSFVTAQTLAAVGDTIHIVDKLQSINITKSGITLEGGIVDGSNNTSADSASILITGDSITVKDIEIINGHSYGIRTYNFAYGRGLLIDNATIHNNVLENKSGTGCNTSASSGWGSAVRAYKTSGLTIRNSRIYENCGEGLSAVMSQNTTGSNLEIRDNFSVNVYPDQSQYFTITNSTISCIKPEYQRFGLSFAVLLGAENYSGVSTNTEDQIDVESNTIYNCKGVGTYSTTGNTWKNITVINNSFYNVPSPAIASISGTNIVTSPNYIYSTTVTPSPLYTKTPTKTISPSLTSSLTANVTITLTPTKTITPSSTGNVTVTSTASKTITATIRPTNSLTTTSTLFVSLTPSPTITLTSTPLVTISATYSLTPTPTITVTPIATRCHPKKKCR